VVGVGLAICLATTVPVTGRAQAGAHDSVVYRVDSSSRFEVRTGKAGLFGFAGHNHRIRARSFTGALVYMPGDPTRSRVSIVVAAESLEVLTPPDTAEIRKVTETMRGQVLDADHYPQIRLASQTLAPTADGFHAVVALTLRGTTRDVPIDVKVQFRSDSVLAGCSFSVKQSDFGISPYRGGPGGTVKVADRVTFDIALVGVRDPGSTAR
jgi:polyisoprenoid-binding protein YceI